MRVIWHTLPMVDADLRSRLIRSEAEAARRLAVSMYERGNRSATTHDVRCGLAIVLGAGRYVNRVLCTSPTLTRADADEIVSLFAQQQMQPSVQVSDDVESAAEVLRRAGFEPDWTRVLMAAPTGESPTVPAAPGTTIGSVRPTDVDEWLDVLARGNAATSTAARSASDEYGRAAHAMEGAMDLLARVDRVPAACGSLQRVDGIGWLGGAATLAAFRGRGFQRALLDHRIHVAGLDDDCVAATALPDSTSSRNLERAGLSVVTRQTVWTLPTPN